MKHLPITARRVAAVAAAVVAGLAISTAAYAATSSGTASTAAASIPKCTAFDLGAWVAVGHGNGALGTIYYPLEFTNLSGHTTLAYHDAVVTTEPGCDPVYSAVLLRIYPPDQFSATLAAFDFEVCSHTGPLYLSILGPITPGVGTANG